MTVLVPQPCRTFCDPMDCSLPGSSGPWDSPGKNTGVGCHSLSRVSFWPRDWTQVSRIAGGFFTCWAAREGGVGVGAKTSWPDRMEDMHGKILFFFSPQKVWIKYKQGTTSILDLVVAEKIKRFTSEPLFFSGPISHASELCWLYLSDRSHIPYPISHVSELCWLYLSDRSTVRSGLTVSLHCYLEQATVSPVPNHCLHASAPSALLFLINTAIQTLPLKCKIRSLHGLRSSTLPSFREKASILTVSHNAPAEILKVEYWARGPAPSGELLEMQILGHPVSRKSETEIQLMHLKALSLFAEQFCSC